MMSTQIFRLVSASLILSQCADVSFGTDPSSSSSRPSRVRRVSDNLEQRYERCNLIQSYYGEIEALVTEETEAKRYFAATNDPIVKNIFRKWIQKLQNKIETVSIEYGNIRHAQYIPRVRIRPPYSRGNEKRDTVHKLRAAGYHLPELDTRSSHQGDDWGSDPYRRTWRNIGDMDREWLRFSRIRNHLRTQTAKDLYDQAMERLADNITRVSYNSRDIFLGRAPLRRRDEYQPGTETKKLKEAFRQHGLDWEWEHGNLRPR